MFNFTPKDDSKKKVPYFEDVSGSDGWEGHRTGKSIDKLLSEIATNFTLIGCLFTGCQKGNYGDRHGFQIHFITNSMPSRLDIACLPTRGNGSKVIEATQQMALFMTAKAIKGSYFLTVLSPSYVPFMSLMLDSKNQTLGETWIQQGSLLALMPPPEKDFEADIVEGETV